MAWIDLAEDIREELSDFRLGYRELARERGAGFRIFKPETAKDVYSRAKRWRTVNRTRHNELGRAKWARNKDQFNENRRDRRQDPDVKAADKARSKAWREANKAKVKAYRERRKAEKATGNTPTPGRTRDPRP